MIKFVHVGDLHIGKIFYGRSRVEDAAYALSQIIDFSKREKPDFILIAGDVFDSYNPDAESINLFFKYFAGEITSLNIPVIIVRGNHDSPTFLGGFEFLAKRSNIHIYHRPSKEPENYSLSIKNVNIIAIPYIPNRILNDLSNEDQNISYANRLEGFIKASISKAPKNDFNILLTHAMISGASISNSERASSVSKYFAINLNNIQNINDLDYVALGHVHKYQQVKASVPTFYPGSCYQVDFNEEGQEKYFNYVVLEKYKTPVVEKQKLEVKNQLKTFIVNDKNVNDVYQEIRNLNGYAKVMIDATLEDSKKLEYTLKDQYISHKILEISRRTFENPQIDVKLEELKNMRLVDFYKSYYEEKYNEVLPEYIEKAFLELEDQVDQMEQDASF